MKQYNAQLKYVGARPRRDKKPGQGGSAVIAGSATPTGGVSKSYIDSNFVTLATEQAIPGRKNFVGGVEVNGQELVYDAEKKVWQLTGDLIVTGAVTMFGSLSGFTPSTVMDAVLVDGVTIVKDEQGRLTVIGGGSGGSGGLTAAEVNLLISNALSPVNDSIATKWTQDDAKISNWDKAYEWGNHALAGYATTSAVSSAISSALTGYATQSWVDSHSVKYLGSASVDSARHAIGYDNLSMGSTNLPLAGGFISADQGNYGFQLLGSIQGNRLFVRSLYDGTVGTWSEIASQSWVGDNYLAKSGGVISSLTIGRGTNGYETLLLNTSTGVGFLIYEGGVNWKVSDANWSNSYSIIHSGNIGQQSVNYATSAGASDSVSVTPVTESGNYSLALLTSSSTRTQGVCVSNNHKALFNPSTGALTATSFIGNLTGNADRADVLAKTYSENINYGAGSKMNLIRYTSTWESDGFPVNYTAGLSVMTDYAGWQMVSYGGFLENPYFRSLQDNGTWKAWKQLAFLTDNVASATKLQTARSIWGQPFNGTDNIGYDGKSQWLFMNYNGEGIYITGESISWHDSLNAWAKGLLGFAADGTVSVSNKLAVGRTTADYAIHIDGITKTRGFLSDSIAIESNSSGAIGSNSGEINRATGILYLQYDNSKDVSLCYGGGSVAVGGTTADAKLHVYGDAKINTSLTVATNVQIPANGDRITFNSVSGTYTKGVLAMNANNTYFEAPLSSDSKTASKPPILIGWRDSTYPIYIDPNTNVAVGGTTASAKLHVYGDILATGAITMFSQLSMKNVIDYNGLSLAQLAQIRPTRFTWKDGRDNRIHVGGVADYIQPIIPEVVYETVNKELTVDYSSAAFYIGTSLIKPVVELWEAKDKQQQEIESLKKRVEYLENENRQLRAS